MMFHRPHSRNKILWLALFLGIFFLGNAWAGPVLKDRHFPADIFENQEMRLKLVFEWPSKEGEFEIKSPESIDLSNIKLLAFSQTKETSSSNSGPISRITLALDLMPLKTGSGSVGRFDVLYRKPNQGTWNKIPVSSLLLDIKPPLPWKQIRILLLMLAALVIPVALWFIRSSLAQREHEKNFKVNPRQELYKEAVKKFNDFIAGYTEDYLQIFLSGWSDELVKVVMTHYDIPLRPATPAQILKDLRTRDIPAGELQEIKNLFDKLEQMKARAWSLTTAEIEEIRLALLKYTQSKIITESPNIY
jgi:hypothetical protein